MSHPPTHFPGRFAGKVAVVTGSAQGIGADVSRRLVYEGASVALVDRSDLVREMQREAGTAAVAVTADLETFEGATDAVAAAMAAFGRIDILINNVGGTIWAMPHGGLLGLHKEAAVAEAAGISLYGGCLLESSVGAAAHLHAFAGLRTLDWGCEHFGPQILVDDLVTEKLRFAGFPHPPSHGAGDRRQPRPRQALPLRPGVGVPCCIMSAWTCACRTRSIPLSSTA